MSGKTIVVFATSGGSGMGETVEGLQPSCPSAKLVEGMVLKNGMDIQEILDWADGLKVW